MVKLRKSWVTPLAVLLSVKIPLEIIEDFRIDPERFDFGWTILDDDGKVTINGRFIHKIPNEKKK